MFIKISVKNSIGYLKIDRSNSLNAMNNQVLDEFLSKINELISDSEVRVIIISGSGDKAFIAGADIKLMQRMNKKEALDFAKKGHLLTSLIENSNKPVIAAVNGYAFGGGSELALSCHLRIASENAIFSQPEVKIGLLPGWGGTQRLPRIVGKGIANEIILTGMNISAERAYEIGLVNKVVKKDDLISNCNKIAEAIIRNSPNAINESIKLINISSNLDLKAGLEIEAKRFSDLFNTDETSEGLTAFVQKRAPKY
jgi:enoyl-CoA hydratase